MRRFRGAAVEYARRTWPGRSIVLYGISMEAGRCCVPSRSTKVRVDALIIEATFDSLLNAGRNRFRAMNLPGVPLAQLLFFWGSVQNGFNMFAHNPVDYARSVREPALILHGEADTRATPEQARLFADALGANARLILYAGVPHMAIVEARPDEWRRDAAHFLEKLHGAAR
jgi:pimeloyl-ACP methyl ester carboxylesterase